MPSPQNTPPPAPNQQGVVGAPINPVFRDILDIPGQPHPFVDTARSMSDAAITAHRFTLQSRKFQQGRQLSKTEVAKQLRILDEEQARRKAASVETPKPAPRPRRPKPAPAAQEQPPATEAPKVEATPAKPAEAPKVTPLTREEWLAQVGDPAKTRAEADALMAEADRLYATIKNQLYTSSKQLRTRVPPEAHRVMQEVNDLRAQAGKIKDKAYAQQRMHDDPGSHMRPETTLAGAKNFSQEFGRDEARAAAARKQLEAQNAKPAETTVTAKPSKPTKTPAAAAAQVKSQVEKVIDIQGAKNAAEVQARVTAALEQELQAAQNASGFAELRYEPYGGKQGRILSGDKVVGFHDQYGDLSLYGLSDKEVKIASQYKRWRDFTPAKKKNEVLQRAAASISQAKGAGRLTVHIPGDGSFTVERNPAAIRELLARIKSSGANTWRGIVPNEKPLTKRKGPDLPDTHMAGKPYPWPTWD